MNAQYKKYLLSPEWFAIRERLFKERGKHCQRCGSERILQIHHLTYQRIFKEEMTDLLILCKVCHEKEHEIDIKSLKIKTKSKYKKEKIKRKLDKNRVKDPNKVAAGKKSHRLRVEKFTKNNPVEKVLKRHKAGKYKCLADFNIAFTCAQKRCKRFGIPYNHLLSN